jgi:hypothetical protein
MENKVILGLAINTRMLGLAVMNGASRLLDYTIQLRKEPWSPGKRGSILSSLQPWCTCYTINSVALSIAYEKQTSTQTKELLEEIIRFFEANKVPCKAYHPKTLTAFWKEDETKSKKQVMAVIVSRYPELTHAYQKELRNKNKYYMKLFEAVGVAAMHSHHLQSKRTGR